MSDCFSIEVIQCEDKKFIVVKNTDSCEYYFINHENFEKRKSYCSALVNRLNRQNEVIKQLKKQNKKYNDSINDLLDIRNFIE